jgi:NitT/TauT family transport system substrate-binding protein
MLFLTSLITGCSNNTQQGEVKEKIKLGVLPIEDNLPLVVAKEKGFFDDKNLDVELITFKSAVESQSAIQSGQIDGMITDMVVATLLKDSGLGVKMTSVTFGASANKRRFAIIASPKSNIESLNDLKGRSIGISKNSIIEYVSDNLLEEGKIDPKEVEKTTVAKIPVRLEMLLNDKIDTAVLPEPLVTFAEYRGAEVVIDDTSNLNLSDAVIIMREEILEEKRGSIKDFYAAYAKAVTEINKDPQEFKEIFVEHINIPKPIIEDYQVSKYPELKLPAKEDLNQVLKWLEDKDLLSNQFDYESLVEKNLY